MVNLGCLNMCYIKKEGKKERKERFDLALSSANKLNLALNPMPPATRNIYEKISTKGRFVIAYGWQCVCMCVHMNIPFIFLVLLD